MEEEQEGCPQSGSNSLTSNPELFIPATTLTSEIQQTQAAFFRHSHSPANDRFHTAAGESLPLYYASLE